MKRLCEKISFGWWWPLGWLASYALVLHLLVAGLAGAQLTAKAIDQNWSFFEICYGAGSNSGEAPDGAPAKHSGKSFSCIFCASGGAAATQVTDVAPLRPVFVAKIFSWPASAQSSRLFSLSFSQRQRAPPAYA